MDGLIAGDAGVCGMTRKSYLSRTCGYDSSKHTDIISSTKEKQEQAIHSSFDQFTSRIEHSEDRIELAKHGT